MAVTGLLLVLFLLAHMLGNLKIFFGATDFDAYAAWLRTIGEPVLHNAWFLWIQRVVLLVAWWRTSRRRCNCPFATAEPDRSATPTASARRPGSRPARCAGAASILALFIVWHMLDLTVGVVNPRLRGGQAVPQRRRDFQVWWVNLIYLARCARPRPAHQPRLLERRADARRQPGRPGPGHQGRRLGAGVRDHGGFRRWSPSG